MRAPVLKLSRKAAAAIRRGVPPGSVITPDGKVIAPSGWTPEFAIPRRPTGLGVNALPECWIERRPDGSFWLMERTTEGSEDRCLAVIPAEVIRAAQASRVPLVLEAK